ncbi:hypothetical protein C7974DRAFT_454588 [Boeremia exigua]|uniref:uncharacterized protein n=1 Tax=Boeremia exigua TaxID=749465 RepID=UPI001E8DE3FE|nr:uncharacterized protein C7974DRAFT_454588 [Boeremia exigua]KAH6629705.1 hypothetical protein C7974DRAFT_454588 [Boeremia exigua]
MSSNTHRPSAAPSAPGPIIRAALTFESLATVAGGLYYTFFPQHYLLHTMGAVPAQITTTAIQNTQQYGATIILIGTSVGLFASSNRHAVALRRPLVYGRRHVEEGVVGGGGTAGAVCAVEGVYAGVEAGVVWQRRGREEGGVGGRCGVLQ